MSKEFNRFYEFGLFRIDERQRVLFQGQLPVHLTPKLFDTLLILVQKSGEVIEKDELINAVWSGAFVEESNLAHNISQLRKLFESHQAGAQYIQTIPTRGYRFIAKVKVSQDDGHHNATDSNASLKGSSQPDIPEVTEQLSIRTDEPSPPVIVPETRRTGHLIVVSSLVGLSLFGLAIFSIVLLRTNKSGAGLLRDQRSF